MMNKWILTFTILSAPMAFAQNGTGGMSQPGSSASGPTQPIPSGAAPVPGANSPTSPSLPQTSPQPYPRLPNQAYPDRGPSGVSPFQGVPPSQQQNPGFQTIPAPGQSMPAQDPMIFPGNNPGMQAPGTQAPQNTNPSQPLSQ